jgi:hypothetical protein
VDFNENKVMEKCIKVKVFIRHGFTGNISSKHTYDVSF